MFDNERGVMIESGPAKDCRPDYEAKAKALKERFESTGELKRVLLDFMEKNDTYRFNKISSLAELLGGLTIIEKEQEKNYANVLAMIEKSK